jgi:uncharacterized protein YkwD|tara:strand:+ start:3201 stop:3719 length:519 start_codon:yes stop_codon:yes gene_type:complete
MKKLITILLTLLTLVSFSQERQFELERLILEKVNEFRVSEGLLAVKWNDKVYDAAYHHAYYLTDREIPLSHNEEHDKDNFTELMKAQDRIKHYYNESSWGIENLIGINFIWYKGDIEKIAEWVVNAWIDSPQHKRGMLFDSEGYGTLTLGAVSVLKVTDSCSWGRPTLVLVH